MKQFSAVIDIGANSMRLVIYSHIGFFRVQEVENVKMVAYLRNHLDNDSNLTSEGLFVLIDTLSSFQKVIKSYDLDHFICAATSAIRMAENREDIKERVKKETGLTMTLLTEEEEAYYGYFAVVNSTSFEEGFTVDIGGGSTEITYFKDRKLINSHSFPFGSLTLMEFIGVNNSSTKQLDQLREFIYDHFSQLDWIDKKNVPIIGIGGSARNMVEIDQTYKDYPLAGLHQYEMYESDIEQISQHLIKLNKKQREDIEGLSKDRAETILPAMQVFYCLYNLTKASQFVLSRKGLREGLFYEQLSGNINRHLYHNVLQNSIDELIQEYELYPDQTAYNRDLTKKLYYPLIDSGLSSILSARDWDIMKYACDVYNLGSYVDSESSSQHSFYLLANRTIDGLTHKERLRLALLASFKNKSVYKRFLKPYKNWFSKSERQKLRILGAILKLAYSLNSTKRQVLSDVNVSVEEEKIFIECFCNQDYKPEAYQAEKQKKHLEKALNTQINISFHNH
ncbi:exopolyphosphatase [Alkalibacillus sp. S2W]|uniref:Ppx/GppA phosphatase family protein n=1 Tax=Alkalibacillus sp. S2W TaxID=3386553 RepID=UPI00398C92F3